MNVELPLKGIRVLEVAAYLSAPYAGSLLRALGAEVVKVEPPDGGDPFRRGMDIDSRYFVQFNAGKRSIAVDLKQPEGVQLVKAMLPEFDVLLQNMRPGKAEALGLGEEACKAINPDLVYASISGFGDGGPYRDRTSYDSIGQSMGGLCSIMSDPGAVRLTGTPLADLITAITMTTGILAALVGRRQNPASPTSVQTSLTEAVSSLTIDAMTQYQDDGVTPTRESRHPHALSFLVRTGGDKSICIHISSSSKFWERLAHVIGRPDLLADPRFRTYQDRRVNYFVLKDIIETEVMKRPRDEWERILLEKDIPFGPVLTLAEFVEDPQTKWLKLIEPEHDGQTLVGPPWRFGGQRPVRGEAPPRVGEHTREIVGRFVSPAELERMLAAGIVADMTGGKPAA